MILMEKDGVKRYVPDAAIGAYRVAGWKGVGEAEPIVKEEVIEEEPIAEELFICEHCGREFASKAALTRHINKEHTEK